MKTLFVLAVCFLASAIARAESIRFLGPNETLAEGDIISLASLAPGSNGWQLAGQSGDENSGVIALLPAAGTTATRWRVLATAPGIYALQCLAAADGPMWLDGHTLSGRLRTVLSPNGISGTSWGLYREGGGVNLKCLGKAPGLRWLSVGKDRSVALAAEPEGLPALWQVQVWKKAAATAAR